MSNDQIYSGMGAGEIIKSSISGMISILNQDLSITKDEHGKWISSKKRSSRKPYKYRDHFSEIATKHCKETAYELAEKRKKHEK
jgi:hypothetical protein